MADVSLRNTLRARARLRHSLATTITTTLAKSFATTLSALLLLAATATAYQFPLDAKAFHEAYVLGQRNDQSTGDFLAPYVKQMTEGRAEMHVAEIEILTPFAQVVDDSRKNSSGYTEEQAAQNHQRAGNTILVNITLMLPSAYPQASNNHGAGASSASAASSDAQASGRMQPENFWQNFQFHFKQGGKTVPSKSLRDKAIYSTATKDAASVLDGTAICIAFDAKDVASQETVIEVLTPDGKTISATFDLQKLR